MSACAATDPPTHISARTLFSSLPPKVHVDLSPSDLALPLPRGSTIISPTQCCTERARGARRAWTDVDTKVGMVEILIVFRLCRNRSFCPVVPKSNQESPCLTNT